MICDGVCVCVCWGQNHTDTFKYMINTCSGRLILLDDGGLKGLKINSVVF